MKQLITQETDVNNILFDHVPIDTTPKVPPPPDHSLNFMVVLLPKDKWKSAVAKKKEIKKNQQKVQKNEINKGWDKRINKKSYWQHEKIKAFTDRWHGNGQLQQWHRTRRFKHHKLE